MHISRLTLAPITALAVFLTGCGAAATPAPANPSVVVVSATPITAQAVIQPTLAAPTVAPTTVVARPPVAATVAPTVKPTGPAVTVLDFVAVKGSFGTLVAGTVESHISGQTLSRVPLQISVFDTTGELVKSSTSYVTLDPSQHRGFAATVLTEKDQDIGKVTVQPLTGSAGKPAVRPDLTIDKAEFKPGKYGSNHAQAQFHNNTDTDIKSLLVDVVGFDADGKVIGGGVGLATAIPAHGVAMVEGLLDAPVVPDHVEMYPNW